MATAKQQSGEMTLPELVEALPGVLASGYDGARNGRIRDLPDARTVRWYQTLGMVDRPTAFRGRTALYSRHHLLQLAAIKKLQSSGFPLADIQRGFAGRNDADLARSAGVTQKDVDQIIDRVVLARSKASAARLATAMAGEQKQPSRRSSEFWKARPGVAATPVAVSPTPGGMQSASLGDAGMLLWNGRELTAAERTTLTRVAGPLIGFLKSVQSSAAEPQAEGVSRAATSPHRPEQGARP
jgi:DNA-binding transcriptional MerR regulator